MIEPPLEALSASALRKLLIEEVKSFVECLDTAPTDVLQQKRSRLIAIFNAVNEKEKHEMAPLIWGKNSMKRTRDNHSFEENETG